MFNFLQPMKYRIENLSSKKLIGKHLTMSFAENKTAELWKSFMTSRGEIRNRLNTDLISMQVFDATFNFQQFNPHAIFQKWAAAEVSDFNIVPDGFDSFILPDGLYVVFNYVGDATKAADSFMYIFGTWLPNSNYELDNRPHFELLGDKYKNNDPASEEEIWIPIRNKPI